MRRELTELAQYAFGSVWALELLIVLHREPARDWSRSELVRELRSSDVVVDESIAKLGANGLVTIGAGGTARYGPATTDMDNLVRELLDEYQARPAAVRRLIVQGSADKLRTFADAFKLKSE
jgi:hypothetical protein